MEHPDIAGTLKEFRMRNDLEQEDLARLLETTQQTVSNWESGTIPRAKALRRINHLVRNYQPGLPFPPVPEKRRLHSAVTEVHEIGVQEERIPFMEAKARFRLNTEATPYAEEFISATIAELGPDTPFNTRTAIRYQGLRFEADFLSDNVCAEIKTSPRGPMSRTFLDNGIYQLITLRNVFERLNQQRKHFALFILQKEFPARVMVHLLSSAALHNIHVFAVSSPAEAAEILRELEAGKLQDDEFGDY